MMLKPGKYLQERYEILDQIGSGGMSEVYRAKCHKLNRLVAIKVLKEEFSQDANFVSKFKMEAQSAAGLSHPNIVSVYDVVDEGSLHYIVMEVIEGITLKSYITKKGSLGVNETIGIAIQVAQGIAAAHDQNIIHRDIKPQNMIISRDGKVKVADFGIARAVSSQTVGSTAVGSVHYISPEQARGGYSDSRSDIYSLGITMYEMVTGRVPFDGENTVTIALAHLEKKVTLPHILNPDITPSLERIILKCIHKKPGCRYSNAYELITDLRRALVDPDDNFLKKEPDFDTSSPTVIIGGEDLNAIQESARRGYEQDEEQNRDFARNDGSRVRDMQRDIQVEPNRENGTRKRKKKNSSDNVNPQIERILTTVGIIAAVLVFVVICVAAAQLLGVFNKGSGNTGKATVASTQETTEGLKTTECRVPNVLGMSEHDAVAALEKESLVAEYEYQASDDEQTGLIIQQSVTAGTVVAKQSKVKITIGEGSGKIDLAELNLEELSTEEAQKVLTGHKLIVTVQPESSETVALDMVVRYEPLLAAPGETVTLYVSSGPEVPLTKVPDIRNLTPEQAQLNLEAAMLLLGEETEEKSDTIPQGLVVSQSLEPDSETPQGTIINYTISAGKGTKYVAVVNDDYPLKDLFGPSSGDTQIKVQIVMKQNVNGKEVTKTIIEPRVMSGDITIPVHFKIEGADGVLTGELLIMDLTNDRILKTYPLEFIEVSE